MRIKNKIFFATLIFIFQTCFFNFHAYSKIPYVTVLSPNGGENLTGGNNYNITWSYTGSMPTSVQILYSIDNGSSWISIVSNISASLGTYSWSVPNIESNKCLIKIQEFYYYTTDLSDAVFTIFKPITINPMFFYHYDMILGSEFEDTLYVSNTGAGRTINTTAFLPDYPATLENTFSITENPAPTYLPAGYLSPSNRRIRIKMKADNVGYFQVNFKIATDNCPADSQIVTFYGNVINPRISVNKTSVNFGNLLIGTSKRWDTIKIKNIGTTNLDFNSINFASNIPVFELVYHLYYEGGLDPDSTLNVLIGIDPKTLGLFSDILQITNNSLNNPNISIPVSATVSLPATINLNKSAINFNSIGYLTPSVDSTITISNTSSTEYLYINKVYFDNPDSLFQVINSIPITIAPNSSTNLIVKFSPKEVGIYSRYLHIINTSGNNPDAIVNISGSVIGSTIKISPGTINFGNVGILTDPIDTTITITNTGNYSLKFTIPVLKDSSFQLLTSLLKNVIIDKGKTYDIRLRLSPIVLGSKLDTLKIQNNSSNSPNEAIKLTANVVQPNLLITPSSIDFGTTTVNTPKISKTITIKNTGSTPITITKKILYIDTLSFYFTLNNSSITLSQNQVDSVKIEFFPRTSGVKSDTFKLFSNDPAGKNRYIVLTGTGSGKPVLFSSISTINFGDVLGTQKKDTTFYLRNDGNLDLIISEKLLSGTDKSYFSLIKGSGPIILSSGQKDSIVIRATGNLPVGNKSTQLQITSNDITNSAYKINISAVMKSPLITTNINKIIFDTINNGEKRDSIIVLENVGNSNLKISNIIFDGNLSDYSFLGVTIPFELIPSEKKSVTIRFKPSDAGIRFGRVIFYSDDPSQPELAIPLRGYVRAAARPNIQISKYSIDFGAVEAGKQKDSSFSIKNSGTAILRIDSLYITGIHKSVFSLTNSTPPYNINPNDSINVSLRFSPKQSDTTKPLNASVRIVNNDINSSSIEVPLTGILWKQGVILKPDISIAPDSLNFGNISYEESKDAFFEIKNIGTADLVLNKFSTEGDTASIIIISVPTIISPGGTGQIKIRFLSGNFDDKKILIHFSTNVDSKLLIDLIAKGKGIYPTMIIPSTLDFGKNLINSTKNLTLNISNTGEQDLRIDNILFSGKDSSDFSFDGIALPNTISFNSNKNIIVHFNPLKTGIKDAKLTIKSNDPKNLREIKISAEGIISDLGINKQNNDFGIVVISKQKIDSFLIQNKGNGIITINNIQILGFDASQFSFAGNLPAFPFTLNPGSSLTFRVSFNPTSPGTKTANIEVNYLNLDSLKTSINLYGNATFDLTVTKTKIDFGNVIISRSKVDTFSIQNPGSNIINITNIQILGSDLSQFYFVDPLPSFPFQIGAGAIKPFRIGFQPNSIGNKSANIEITSNEILGIRTIILLSGVGENQSIPATPKILADGDFSAEENKDKTIYFHLSQNYKPDSVVVFYKNGNEINFNSTLIPPKMDSNYSYTFDKSRITKWGLNFYIKFVWKDSVKILPENDYVANPLSLQINIKDFQNAFSVYKEKYMMFTIPFTFNQSTFLDEISKNLGSNFIYSWRIFRWKNDNYEEFPTVNHTGFIPGQGFWLITQENKSLNFFNGTLTSATYKITLRPGWNQIGNPFVFPVQVAGISKPANSKIENVLWAWDFNQTYTIEEKVLNPFQGYFIKNNEQSDVDIYIKPLFYQASVSKTTATIANLLANEWEIKILLKDKDGNIVNKNAILGSLASSNDEWDINDISEPPQISTKSSYPSIRFPHNDWKTYSGNYVRDFRSINKDLYTWNFEVLQSNESLLNNYELVLENSNELPADFGLFLLDYDLGFTSPLEQLMKDGVKSSSYKFHFQDNQKIKNFRITVGKKDYVEKEIKDQKLEITNYSLSQNYPNPFNPSTRISYSLPENNFTQLKIFNSLGQEIATLVNKVQASGNYYIDWYPNDLPSGIYYYKIQAGSFIEVKKMMYVR